MLDGTQDWPLVALAAAMAAAGGLIAFAGVRLTRTADRLADATGLGEALFGAVLLGATTSLPGIATSVSTAWYGFGELSVSNAIGGIAAQTAFLSIADIAYRRANLEHASASPGNLFQAALLSMMLAVPLATASLPAVTAWGIHPTSILLLAIYVMGVRVTREIERAPGWRAERTSETVLESDADDGMASVGTAALWTQFALLAAVVAAAGYFVGQLGIGFVQGAGLSESVVGVLLTAVATSLPELVTCVAAVRRKAVDLAVGGIIGGNAFDMLFLSFSDVAYRDGSLYHAMTDRQVFLISIGIVMSCLLLLGLLRRQRRGVASIGLESALVLVVYAGAVLALTRM